MNGENTFFLYGTYEGNELVIRLTDQIVSEVKLEKTGSGWAVSYTHLTLPTIYSV